MLKDLPEKIVVVTEESVFKEGDTLMAFVFLADRHWKGQYINMTPEPFLVASSWSELYLKGVVQHFLEDSDFYFLEKEKGYKAEFCGKCYWKRELLEKLVPAKEHFSLSSQASS